LDASCDFDFGGQSIPLFREIIRNALHGVYPRIGDRDDSASAAEKKDGGGAVLEGDDEDKAAILRRPFELGVLSTWETEDGRDQIHTSRHEHWNVKRLQAVPLRTIQEDELMLAIAKVRICLRFRRCAATLCFFRWR
jgi:hypothetical protein